MESLTIEIINPAAKKVLQELANKHFINISENINDEEVDEDSWNSLTHEQQQGIFKAIKEIENGKGIPHEVVMAEFQNKYQNG